MNDATKKRSALAIASLAIALFACLCFALVITLAYSDYDDAGLGVGAFLSLFITPVGIIIGLIALFKRRTRLGLSGLTGLTLNILLLVISIFIILKELLEEFMKAMAAVH